MGASVSFQAVRKLDHCPWGVYHLGGNGTRHAAMDSRWGKEKIRDDSNQEVVGFKDHISAIDFLSFITPHCYAGAYAREAIEFIKNQESPNDFAYFVVSD